jgi:hypothetical protein
MLIAERTLKIKTLAEDIEVPISIYLPREVDGIWLCKFTIEWPDGELQMDSNGSDSVQAIELALKMIGAFLYTSDHHASGKLVWLESDHGYGFPVANNMRDMLVGDDKKFF